MLELAGKAVVVLMALAGGGIMLLMLSLLGAGMLDSYDWRTRDRMANGMPYERRGGRFWTLTALALATAISAFLAPWWLSAGIAAATALVALPVIVNGVMIAFRTILAVYWARIRKQLYNPLLSAFYQLESKSDDGEIPKGA